MKKHRRIEVSKEMLPMDDALKRIIAEDKKRFNACDPEAIERLACERCTETQNFTTKVFQNQGHVCHCLHGHKECLRTGQTVNEKYYLDVMKCLRQSIRKKARIMIKQLIVFES